MLISKNILISKIELIEKTGVFPFEAEKIFPKRSKLPRTLISDLKEKVLSIKKEEISLNDILPEFDCDNEDHHVWFGPIIFLISLIFNEMLSKTNEVIKFENDLTLIERKEYSNNVFIDGNLRLRTFIDDNEEEYAQVHCVVYGNLVISGKIEVEEDITLIVLGDLIVNNGYFDSAEWNLVIICGELKTNNFIMTRGDLFVTKSMIAPIIFARYNHGRLFVFNGITSKIFYELDHDGQIWGKNNIDIAFSVLKGIKTTKNTDKLIHIKSFLKPEYLLRFNTNEYNLIDFHFFDFIDDIEDELEFNKIVASDILKDI